VGIRDLSLSGTKKGRAKAAAVSEKSTAGAGGGLSVSSL